MYHEFDDEVKNWPITRDLPPPPTEEQLREKQKEEELRKLLAEQRKVKKNIIP